MTDRPVIGQLGRTDAGEQLKVEIIGSLTPQEWAEFVECLTKCAGRFKNKITVQTQKYKVRIPILDQLPKKP
jgi:hypothetical protein